MILRKLGTNKKKRNIDISQLKNTNVIVKIPISCFPYIYGKRQTDKTFCFYYILSILYIIYKQHIFNYVYIINVCIHYSLWKIVAKDISSELLQQILISTRVMHLEFLSHPDNFN